MQKYLKVQKPESVSTNDCQLCAMTDVHGICKKDDGIFECPKDEYYILNPAWRTASQRVRELLKMDLIHNDSRTAIKSLADELEQEEKEEKENR